MKNVSLILFTSFLIIFGCDHHTETITPKTTDVVESVYASGIVKSKNQYEVFTKINGVVDKIFVEEGEQVSKGTPILRIENIKFEESARGL